KDGKVTVYEAELVEAGQPNREVSVTADGKINAEEETVPLEKVPAPARKAIEAAAKGAKIERVNRIKRASGQLTYEALYVNKGKRRRLSFNRSASHSGACSTRRRSSNSTANSTLRKRHWPHPARNMSARRAFSKTVRTSRARRWRRPRRSFAPMKSRRTACV